MLMLIFTGTLLRPATVAAAEPPVAKPFDYFPETGQLISGEIRAFFAANGGVATFGMPISQPFPIDGGEAQYFERARLELRDQQVEVAKIGVVLTAGRSDESAFVWRADPRRTNARLRMLDLDTRYFQQTGHAIDHEFLTFWEKHGVARIFGLPISEGLLEEGRIVQYFERARLELQMNGEVGIGLLGVEVADILDLPATYLTRQLEPTLLGVGSIAIDESARHNVELALKRFDRQVVPTGAEHSFLQQLGEVSTASGYQTGEAIVAGRLATLVGGGVCYVSTAVYRAALYGGMPVTQRQAHSLALPAFEDVPGTDAAIETSSLDLRWKNDTEHPLMITGQLEDNQLVVALWGVSDGRVVKVTTPEVTDTEATFVWQLDPKLGNEELKEELKSRPARQVSFIRTVFNLDGSVRWRETVRTVYTAFEGLVLHGKDIVPPTDKKMPKDPRSLLATPTVVAILEPSPTPTTGLETATPEQPTAEPSAETITPEAPSEPTPEPISRVEPTPTPTATPEPTP
jgi:hypothetical protein